MSNPQTINHPTINGVRFDPLSPEDVVERIERYLAENRSAVVHFLPAHPTVLARRDRAYRQLLNRAQLNLPDGASVTWALRLARYDAKRFTGSDGFHLLCTWGLGRGVRHFLYGGTPGVLAQLSARMQESYPGIRIVGAIAPPFRPLTEDELEVHTKAIKASRSDLLWIGLGTPQQDVVADAFRAVGCARVILGVGAVFDFASGSKRRAPRWLQRLGLEWAFRLVQEPRRLARRYLVGNTLFVAGVLRDAIFGPKVALESLDSPSATK